MQKQQEEKVDSIAQAVCKNCGSVGIWRVYRSINTMQCHSCGTPYKLDMLVGYTPIKHQR